jgi:drug/metabolite transporter (DMT)-like permease
LLLMTGLQSTSASFGSVLANIEGIATAIAAWCLFREKTSAPGVAGVIAVLAGVVLFTVTTDPEASDGRGPLLVGAAYLCWALDINLMRKAKNFDPAVATALRGIIGALVMGGVAAIKGEALPEAAAIAGGLLTGAIGFGISFILVLKALPLIGSAKAGAMFASAPVFGYVYSLAIEGGSIDLHRLAAMAVISVGILIAAADAFARDRTANRNRRHGTHLPSFARRIIDRFQSRQSMHRI